MGKIVEQTLGWASWTNSGGEARENLEITSIRLAEHKLNV